MKDISMLNIFQGMMLGVIVWIGSYPVLIISSALFDNPVHDLALLLGIIAVPLGAVLAQYLEADYPPN